MVSRRVHEKNSGPQVLDGIRSLANALPDLWFLLDAGGVVRQYNERVRHMLGRDAMLGERLI
ncbi:MAG: hypothetical protein ACE5H0_07075, partial [Bacteroidota bacterium]